MLFEGNVAKNNGNGFAAGSPASQLVYRNNLSRRNWYGFTYCPCNGAPGGRDVTLQENQLLDNTSAGVHPYGTPSAVPSEFVLRDNIVSGTHGAGRLPDGVNGVFVREVRDVLLQRNTIDGSGNHGALVLGATGIQILDNVVRRNSQAQRCEAYGIFVKDDDPVGVNADSVTIAQNRVYDDQSPPSQGRGIVISTRGTVSSVSNIESGNYH